MNSKLVSTLVIALATVGAANSFAATNSSPLTREQVRAEYFQAAKAGTLPVNGDIAYVPSTKFESTKTRAEVRAEYFQAVKAGTLPANGDIAYVPSTKFESNQTRAQVQGEYLQARQNGTLPVVVTE